MEVDSPSSNATDDGPSPMDIETNSPSPNVPGVEEDSTHMDSSSTTSPSSPPSANVEEEARKAIEALLRGGGGGGGGGGGSGSSSGADNDVSERVAAANRLEAIAIALGVERTREELLPFLADGMDDEDEVLAAIATSLGKLIPHVGGQEFVHVLLPPLEILLTVEEGSVRDKASESAHSISEALPDESFRDRYADMLSRLATKEWFTARMSACGLIAASFARLSKTDRMESDGERYIEHFSSLCRDDAPMVRRVASQHLGLLLMNLVESSGRRAIQEGGVVSTTFLPLYEELAASGQPDAVRLQTTENCIAFGKAMSALAWKNDDTNEDDMQEDEDGGSSTMLVNRVLPLIVSTIDDRSWRVRWTAASKFAEVVKAFSELPGAVDSLVPAYEKLLQDPEAEVRTAATLNLSEVAKCKGKVRAPPSGRVLESPGISEETGGSRISVAERLVKRVTSLTEDDSENVRAALAMVATELAPILGKEATISHLVPPILLLLRDTTSEVRLNIISSLSALNEVIGVDLLSQSLLPAILDLAADGKWRIRLEIIKHIPLLAKQLGKDFFSEKLSSLCVGWLSDDISSIRKAAATNLKELTALFGSEWASLYLIPSIKDIGRHKSYLRRLTAVQACAMMATVMDPETAQIELLPTVLEMASDTVPNIRFNVAKGLQTMAPVCGNVVWDSQIRPVLVFLVEDPDRDVRFFANRTVETLDREFGGLPQ